VKLKLDENLGHSSVKQLRDAGHDVSTVHEQSLCSATDRALYNACVQEARCLVILDLDFSNPMNFPPAESARPPQ
jgi:predicted nuclease of predicted toxin-antitoxin system